MAKLQSLKMRKDDGERQIKCLIIEDSVGDAIKYFNPSEFQSIIETTDKDRLTKVYSATLEDKQAMLEKLKDNIVVEDGAVSINITEADLIMQLFVMFTDLEIDLEDKELIESVVANPNDVFVAIKIEVDKILMSIFETFIATQRTLQSNPHATEMIAKDIVEDMEAKARAEKEAKIAELQAQLAELGVK
jgi:hypothetical protein